ncbi:hypothetical protein FJZ31_30065 [Candidatus Poribacteria bacterium]|nr:hypothetical protein [Candidatus Poribacteria bacterium]
MNTRLIIIACVIFSVVSPVNATSWIDIPLEERIAKNSVVVIGKIKIIKIAKPSEGYDRIYQHDTVYITVSKVLKNELKDKIIKKGSKHSIVIPSLVNELWHWGDIRYKYITEGIWILAFRDNAFRAEYPKDYQPLTEEKEITLILEKQGSKYIGVDHEIRTFYGMSVSSMIQTLGVAISLILIWRFVY